MPTFDFELGDWTPPPALAKLERTSLAWNGQLGDDAVGRLISEFQKPRIEAFLRATTAGVQDLEDGTWQGLTLIWLDTAEGVWLDVLGIILNLERAGWGDDTYRAYLKAQILVLGTDGSWPRLESIMATIGVDLTLTTVEDSGTAAARVQLGELLDGQVLPADVFSLLVRAKTGGVRLTLEFPTVELTDAFTWADADVDQADTRRGWPTDDVPVDGGYWNGELATTEAA